MLTCGLHVNRGSLIIQPTVEGTTVELLIGLLCGFVPADLGHQEYARREAATVYFRVLGPLAFDRLRPLLTSEEPELRDRAYAILRPWIRIQGDSAVLRKWLAGDAPNPVPLICDDAERHRLALACYRAGLLESGAAAAVADGEWWWTTVSLTAAHNAYHGRPVYPTYPDELPR